MAEEPQPFLPSPVPPSEGDHSADTKRSDREREPSQGAGAFGPEWKLAFALFAAGFLLLVIAAKLQLRPAFDWLLKGIGAIACGVGLFAARRARHKPLK